MLRSTPDLMRLRRLPMPVLPPEIAAPLAALDFTCLAVDVSDAAWPVGFEASLFRYCAERLQVAAPNVDMLGRFGVDYTPGIGAPYQQRPASELAAYAIWKALEKGALDKDAIINANRILGGSRKLREAAVLTTPFPSGHRIAFDGGMPPDRFLRRWLAAFHAPCPQHQVLAKAIWLFVDFLIAHPFTDGNGRTARLLFQAFLHAHGRLRAPLLPLGPVFLANQRAFLNAIWAWEFAADPAVFYRFMLSAIVTTKEASHHLLLSSFTLSLKET